MLENVFAGLQKPVRHELMKIGIEEPSDIQSLAIPKILSGGNVLLIAPTGTGKTLAAVLPVFDMFVSARAAAAVHGISILYVTPLRALNRDILRRLEEIGKNLDIKVQVRHGDTSASARSAQARSPPDMLITTPETLQAILPGRRMREHLKSVRWVVVDEIHELATDKRGCQLSLALERLEFLCGRPFQRIGLSATIGEEQRVASFLVGSGREATVVKSEESKAFDVRVEHISPSPKDHKDAERLGIPAASIARAKRIAELVENHRSTLVFTNTREHAEAIGSQLHALYKDLPIRVHHGSLSKELREDAERGFQSGSVKGVVCTSSLELGIDVGSVDFIVQYMSPRESTRLIQRVGRSGHRLRGIPKGTILTTLADDILESGVIVKNASLEHLEEPRFHEKALDVLAHQIVGFILDLRRTTIPQALDIFTKAYLYQNITPDEFMSVVRQLEAVHVVRVREDVLFAKFPRAFKYYYENLSVIPDVKRYTVFDFIRKKRIGSLDQQFVARRCKSGTEFIMHGHTWKVISVKEETQAVEVEPTSPSLDAIPSWEGELIPVSFDTATEVGSLRKLWATAEEPSHALGKVATELRLDTDSQSRISDTLKKHAARYAVPDAAQIVIEKFENCIVLHVCFGNLVNEAIAMALVAILESRYGVNVATQTDPYRVALISPFKLEPEIVSKELLSLSPEDFEIVVNRALEDSALFAWRHWHVAKRFGAIERRADYKMARAHLLVKALKDTPVNLEAKREIFAEKLDIERAKQVLERIQRGEIDVIVAGGAYETCSPLALPIIDKIIPHDLLRPAVPEKALIEIIKERLHSHSARLVCIFNADWEGIRVVGDLPERLKCPKCSSTLITATYYSDEGLLKVAQKKKRGRKLTQEEEQAWSRAWLSASLVQTNGKKAVVAMSGRGVGPTTAARILRRPYRSEADFIVDILKAERDYARTRIFWD